MPKKGTNTIAVYTFEVYPSAMKPNWKGDVFGKFDCYIDEITRGGKPIGSLDWVRHIRERPKDKPFFFWFAPDDAHRSWQVTEHAPTYEPDEIIIPPYMVFAEQNWHVYSNHSRMVRSGDYLYIKNNYTDQLNLCHEAHYDPAAKDQWQAYVAGKTTPAQQLMFANPVPSHARSIS